MVALVRHGDAQAAPHFTICDTERFGDANEIARLYRSLGHVNEQDHPRIARLLAAGRRKMARKLMEEVSEVALEAARCRSRAVVRESADLIYNLVVVWFECGIAPEEVWSEMRRRAEHYGLAEKLPKPAAGSVLSAASAAGGSGR
jgi:phosphoribosyl-ATP pyrophosphohydrolase